jgi:NitT/TauT family transport system permease protein
MESLSTAGRGGRRAMLSRRAMERWAMPALGIATLFGGWALLSGLGLVSPAFLPGPLAVLRSMAEHTREPYAGSVLQMHLLASLEKFLISFSIAVLLGVPLGLFMGRFRALDWAVAPVFEAFRFIPPIAWVPFAIFWFGTGFLSPTLVIFAGAFAPCVLNAYRGARQIDRALIEAGQMLGAGRWATLTEILLPASLAHIVAGIRVHRPGLHDRAGRQQPGARHRDQRNDHHRADRGGHRLGHARPAAAGPARLVPLRGAASRGH